MLDTKLHGELMFSTSFLSQFLFTLVESQLLKGELFGLIISEVSPPSDLHMPVLPFKIQLKLFFPLCRRCVEEGRSTVDSSSIQLTPNKCIHSQLEDRYFWGTFTTPEVKVGLDIGCRIFGVAGIWSWSRSKTSLSLFKNYLKKFFKNKMGPPVGHSQFAAAHKTRRLNSEIYVAYLKDIRKKGGISLDTLKVSKN